MVKCPPFLLSYFRFRLGNLRSLFRVYSNIHKHILLTNESGINPNSIALTMLRWAAPADLADQPHQPNPAPGPMDVGVERQRGKQLDRLEGSTI
jgi:hypothetical protein